MVQTAIVITAKSNTHFSKEITDSRQGQGKYKMRLDLISHKVKKYSRNDEELSK